jgi:predicted NAD-dependent protein-ADP-ribosyltransferase YbiA (DUF1768 family)/O-acetyl-ADP-ribose deacetylase (regulator of RNase III)
VSNHINLTKSTVEQYIKSEVVWFCKTQEACGGLSNMCAGFPIGACPSSESYYQSLKFPPGPLRVGCRSLPAYQAKQYAYQHRKFWYADWEKRKVTAMRIAISKKAEFNPKFIELLLKTGSKPIVELSTRDSWWGTQPSGAKLSGYNILGKLLMELRQSHIDKSLVGKPQTEQLPTPTSGYFLTRPAINYVVGDAANPIETGGMRIITHCCNDIGMWGKGFVLALSRKWKQTELAYRAWYSLKEYEGVPFRLGHVQFVEVEPNLWVANLLGQHGIARPSSTPPIRYDAIRQGLTIIANYAKYEKASVHMPRIGSGLAGGSWQLVSEIIQDRLLTQGVEVTVYDLQQ